MKIALIAHDRKKDDMVKLAVAYRHVLEHHIIYATGTTGSLVAKNTGLPVNCMKSGPLGGDQQIGSLVAQGEMDLVIFLRDPLAAQPHEPDILALLRLCDVHNIPLATNNASAENMLLSLQLGALHYRMYINEKKISDAKISPANSDLTMISAAI